MPSFAASRHIEKSLPPSIDGCFLALVTNDYRISLYSRKIASRSTLTPSARGDLEKRGFTSNSLNRVSPNGRQNEFFLSLLTKKIGSSCRVSSGGENPTRLTVRPRSKDTKNTIRKMEEWEIGYSRQFPAEKETAKDEKKEKHQESAFTPGLMLGNRFQLIRDLTSDGADAGGLGLVLLAKDTKLMSRDVIVKVLKPEALKDANIVRKFIHEKEALSRLSHPNIVRILDHGNFESGEPFLVMEFVRGYSLRRRLKEHGPMALNDIALIVDSVADALATAHGHGILHRDVKPENIMLTPVSGSPFHVTVIDFGIARIDEPILAPKTTFQRGAGTIIYASPEQLRGDFNQSPATDVFSFAAVVYEMITGQIPFQPKSHGEIFELHRSGVKTKPSRLRPEIRDELESVVLAGLSTNPEDRPQDVAVFGSRLSSALRQSHQNPKLPAPTVSSVAFEPPNQQPKESEQATRTTSLFKAIFVIATAIALLLCSSLLSVYFLYLPKPKLAETAYPAPAEQERAEQKSSGESRDGEISNSASANSATSPVDVKSVQLRYFLNVQKMRNGRPFESPFKSSGMEIFETGYKFRFHAVPSESGRLYLFAEDKDKLGNTVFNLLFPTPTANDGVAEVQAAKEISSAFNTFSGNRGTETVWLVWTLTEVGILEESRKRAFESPEGTLSDKRLTAELMALLSSSANVADSAKKDTENRESIVTAKGPTAAFRIELEHR